MILYNRKKVIMLDIESVGLKGDVVSIQVSYEYMKKEYIFLPDFITNNDAYNQFKKDLNNPDNCFIGFNIAFDLYKLYCLLKPTEPFKACFMDLSFHLLDSNLLNGILTSGKSLLNFKAVPEDIAVAFDTTIKELFKDILPSKVSLKKEENTTSHINKGDLSKSEKTKFFHDMQYTTNINRKLKTICSLLFRGKQVYNGSEALYLKEYKEDKGNFFITKEEQDKHDKIKIKLVNSLKDKNSKTYKYSLDDVRLLWELKKWLETDIEHILIMNINDCCSNIIAYTKYIGFSIDVKKANDLQIKFEKKLEQIKNELPIKNINSSQQRVELLRNNTIDNSIYSSVISSSSKENIQKYIDLNILNDKGLIYATNMLEIGQCGQRLRQISRMLLKYDGKRVYPDLRIDGTVTNRMSGRGGLNFQGIPRDGEIRELILTAFGGDFASLEITLANGSIGAFDEQLEAYEKGLSLDIHAFTAMNIFNEEWQEIFGTEKDMSKLIQEVKKIKEDKKGKYFYKFKNLRNKGKQANFTMLYGGTTRLGKEEAEKFYKTYPQIKDFHKKVTDAFITICPENDTPNWSCKAIDKMSNGVQNIFGLKRYVKFEKNICNLIFEKMDWVINRVFDLLPSEFRDKLYQRNKKEEQKLENILKSILCGSLTNLQTTLSRQVKNFPIQASGAELCKRLMCYIFIDHGIPMLNIHDEIIVPKDYEEHYEGVKIDVKNFLQAYKKNIKYIDLELDLMKNWSDKK